MSSRFCLRRIAVQTAQYWYRNSLETGCGRRPVRSLQQRHALPGVADVHGGLEAGLPFVDGDDLLAEVVERGCGDEVDGGAAEAAAGHAGAQDALAGSREGDE